MFCLYTPYPLFLVSFFFNAPATPGIYTLSLHDALPIWREWLDVALDFETSRLQVAELKERMLKMGEKSRSEEHTSELQSHSDLVCRLLLEKKNNEQLVGDGALVIVGRYTVRELTPGVLR